MGHERTSLTTKVSHTADRQVLCGCCPEMSAQEYLGSTKFMVSTPQTRCPDKTQGIQITYISEVQCSSACEREAERTGHLALGDRLAWQTSINPTRGSGSHCNDNKE